MNTCHPIDVDKTIPLRPDSSLRLTYIKRIQIDQKPKRKRTQGQANHPNNRSLPPWICLTITTTLFDSSICTPLYIAVIDALNTYYRLGLHPAQCLLIIDSIDFETIAPKLLWVFTPRKRTSPTNRTQFQWRTGKIDWRTSSSSRPTWTSWSWTTWWQVRRGGAILYVQSASLFPRPNMPRR